MAEVLNPRFDFEKAVAQTAEIGYAFASDAIIFDTRKAMELEVGMLTLEGSNHVDNPINAGTAREVRQLHERSYLPVGHEDIPIATHVAIALVAEMGHIAHKYASLADWFPNEAGYQRYRSTDDHISPHRDRKTDEIMGAAITINGSALVKIHEPVENPNNYRNLRQVDEFRTSPGSIMLLRAPGLGNGEQVIHEVLPPERGSRLILNLRMRPDVLKQPNATNP